MSTIFLVWFDAARNDAKRLTGCFSSLSGAEVEARRQIELVWESGNRDDVQQLSDDQITHPFYTFEKEKFDTSTKILQMWEGEDWSVWIESRTLTT